MIACPPEFLLFVAAARDPDAASEQEIGCRHRIIKERDSEQRV